MPAHVQSSAVLGIGAYIVHVKVDVSNGLPMMAVVRLIRRSQMRTRGRGGGRAERESASVRKFAPRPKLRNRGGSWVVRDLNPGPAD
jgi:hypothetical protein